ncbi:hypothetical protein [Streptomyces agglomeratus]|uniref:hypothetical protein n=1 Tax=Streptomyces agglomeratus TaxID=285458 RepID=UPI00159F027E|nr:hypothetical protein [Streptomyces agglomeratus]
MNAAVTAVVSIATSGVVAFLTVMLSGRQQRRGADRAERDQLNAQYLNPLRWQAAEVHYRLAFIGAAVERTGSYAPALAVEQPSQVEGKDPTWFNGHGCALLSTTYLIAGLFAQLKRVRDDFPYLRLAGGDDTRLAALIVRVQLAFLRDGGVYYAVQPSIGDDVLRDQGNRVRTYREFCELLMDPERRVWLDILIHFTLETSQGRKQQRLHDVLEAVRDLSDFLDQSLAGGQSLRARWAAEGARMDARELPRGTVPPMR